MSDVRVTARTGEETLIVGAEIDDFRSSLVGGLMQIEDPGYNEARSLWNAMIDRRPSLIARCAGTADVIHSVNFAREHNLLVTVRGAGHNIAGMPVLLRPCWSSSLALGTKQLKAPLFRGLCCL